MVGLDELSTKLCNIIITEFEPDNNQVESKHTTAADWQGLNYTVHLQLICEIGTSTTLNQFVLCQ